MGCDIHAFVEYREKLKEEDEKVRDVIDKLDNTRTGWLPAETWVFDDKWDEGKKSWRVPYHQRPYSDRNYNFFSWLADVRNTTWGEQMPVLSAPRGLPEGVCERIREASNDYGSDGHSHSYFTLKELEEGWKNTKDKIVWFNGALNPTNPSPELKVWLATPESKRGAPPGGFCAWGSNCEKFKWSERVEDIIGTAYRRVRSYMNDVRFEFSTTDENVRFVFWFDN